MNGIFGISSFFDSAGPMAKSAFDLLPLLDLMLQRPSAFEIHDSFSGLKIGFADPKIWKLWDSFCPQHEGTAEQMVRECTKIIKQTKWVLTIYSSWKNMKP
jgi:amidase